MSSLIKVGVGEIYFSVAVPCGQTWPGMRNTEDVQIVMDRAMKHVKACEACRKVKS